MNEADKKQIKDVANKSEDVGNTLYDEYKVSRPE